MDFDDPFAAHQEKYLKVLWAQLKVRFGGSDFASSSDPLVRAVRGSLHLEEPPEGFRIFWRKFLTTFSDKPVEALTVGDVLRVVRSQGGKPLEGGKGAHLGATASRPPYILYLDQSDWSYLAKGSVVAGVDYRALRLRLTELSRRGVVRVRVSFVHGMESLRLDRHQLLTGLEILRALPGAVFAVNGSDAIFRHEVIHPGVPVPIVDVPVGRALMTRIPLGLRAVLHLVHLALRLGVSAHRAAKAADRKVDSDTRRRQNRAVRSSDPTAVLTKKERRQGVRPPLRVRLGIALSRPIMDILRRWGYYHVDDNPQRQELQHDGVMWMASLGTEHVRRAVALGPKWESTEAAEMPACALRVAFERKINGDLRYDDQPSDTFDAAHLAYIAYSDAATADTRVIEATKNVRKHLARPRWLFPPGRLDKLLNCLEAETSGRAA
jgi:hypothetical protein